MIVFGSNPDKRHTSAIPTFLFGCFLGMAIGSAVGVLIAPHRGDITRRRIKRKVEDIKDHAVEVVEARDLVPEDK